MHTDHQTTGRTIRDRKDVLDGVTRIVAEQMGMQAESIDERSALVEDLGCDSLDIVEISMELEEHFEISIPDDFDEQARNIGEVTDGVLRLLAGSSPG